MPLHYFMLPGGLPHPEPSGSFDSGCSFHMCPNKTWFDTYEEKSGGNVFMGNDVSCKTIGIGTVKIKMHDGIIRTLTEVRHVPELKKNLISIGIMDGKGFKCSTENGVMKIQKGSIMVMKGIKRGNLYILQGTTCFEDGLVAVASRSNKSIPDLTQLWHMRLGHMSEKGMMILQK